MSTTPAKPPVLLVVSPFSPEALQALAGHYEVVQFRSLAEPAAFCAEHGNRVAALVTNGVLGVPAVCRDTLPALGLIACNGVGYDAIDLDWAAARGVRVSNTPDVLSGDVADLAIALALAAFRQLPAADRFVREGAWPRGAFPLARRFWGSRVGVLGLGRIGKLIAQRAAAFDCEIGYCGRAVQPEVPYSFHTSAAALAAWADVLVVATPGGAATHHLVSAEVIESLGAQGVLVNVSRGSVVDQRALVLALQSGALGGAGLDVFEDEPRVPESLIALPRVVLAPHIASATVQTRAAMAALVVDNLLAHVRGAPLPTPVN